MNDEERDIGRRVLAETLSRSRMRHMDFELGQAANRGKFITVEGIDGVGKSSHLETIQTLLKDEHIDFVATREPGGTPMAEEVRKIILAKRDEPVDPLAETLMMFAARSQHVATVVKPALDSGRWVVCDRFTDSTFAYQCGGRGVDYNFVEYLEATVHGDCRPDFTLYFDAPPEIALGRINMRTKDRLEGEAVEFYQRTRDVFRQRARTQENMVEVDASENLDVVSSVVDSVMRQFVTESFQSYSFTHNQSSMTR